MSVGRLLSRHYLSKIGSGRVEINFYLLNPNNNRCWRATPVWIFDWDNIERAHVANQKPELRSPERIVFGQRKKQLQRQQQNAVVLDLALKEIPVPVQIHFVCEEIFGRMSQLKASSCLFTESQDAADILSKSFLTLDLPIYRICAR